MKQNAANPFDVNFMCRENEDITVGDQHQTSVDVLARAKNRGHIQISNVMEQSQQTPNKLQVMKREVDAYLTTDAIAWESNPLQ